VDKSPDMQTSLRQAAEEAGDSLPALQALAEKAVSSVLHGDHGQSRPGMGEKFWQYREYAQGDRPQDIDWKQTAKTDHIYIRQKELQTTQTAIFWCSQSQSMHFSSSKNLPEKIKAARVLTLALGLLLTKAGEQIGAFGSRKHGRSSAALDDLGLKITEDIRSTSPLPDPSIYDIPRHAFFVQLGDFLDPLEIIEENFKQFSAQSDGGLVIQILDPAEIELSYNGRVLFEDSSKGLKQQIENVASIRQAYQSRVKSHIAALEQLTKEQNWHYILHRTDHDYKETLSSIWQILSYSPASNRHGRR
jgi:uncharacterized protein (DUF58 family)